MSRGRLNTIPMIVVTCGVCESWDAINEPTGDTQRDMAQATALGWVCTDAYGWICPDCTGKPKDTEETFAERLKNPRPGLSCCGEDGACTGGPTCWHDEPDNIPEDWS